jgi:hypothetical protein
MISQELRQSLHEQKRRIGLVGGSMSITEYDESEHNVVASISPEGWNIDIKVRKGFNPIKDRRQKAYARKKGIVDGLEVLLSHVGILHECAHWELPYGSGRGCPYDLYNHDRILEAIRKGLSNDKQTRADYVTNAFEDSIINPRAREYNGDFSGQVLFWDWEGLSRKEQGKEFFTPFYEAFVKLGMYLFGDNVDRALLKRHFSNNEKVDWAVREVIQDLGLPENIDDTRKLFEKGNWPNMAENFSRKLGPLLEKGSAERLSAYSENGQRDGKGGWGSGNGIEQKMRTGKGKEEIAFGRYSSNDRHSPNFTSYEQLDFLYKMLARAIPVRVESMTRKQGLGISALTYRAFDEENDDPFKVKLTKLFLSDDGLKFGYPDEPLTVEQKSKIQRRNFPSFKLVVLDNSGSMKFAPDGSSNVGSKNFIPWGDKSKYHYALLGHYGIENFLQQQGIAQYIDHGVSLFSSRTRYREDSFLGLDEVRKLVLNPDWGSTNLDSEVLGEALRGGESFALSISDGVIGNWASERDEIKNLVKNNYFAHIQIGEETDFTRDLEAWGAPVFYVSSGEGLSRLMVDVTKKTYGRFTNE